MLKFLSVLACRKRTNMENTQACPKSSKALDQDEIDVEMHFSKEEWSKMSEYEKKRLTNVKKNYLAMTAMGRVYTKFIARSLMYL